MKQIKALTDTAMQFTILFQNKQKMSTKGAGFILAGRAFLAITRSILVALRICEHKLEIEKTNEKKVGSGIKNMCS